MTLEEHSTIIGNLAEKNNDADVQKTLLSLADDYKIILSDSEKLKQEIEGLKKENSDFAHMNSVLWNRLKSDEKEEAESDAINTKNAPKKRKFSDLKF